MYIITFFKTLSSETKHVQIVIVKARQGIPLVKIVTTAYGCTTTSKGYRKPSREKCVKLTLIAVECFRLGLAYVKFQKKFGYGHKTNPYF